MLAIIGALSLAAGAALLRYAMISNQRKVKPAWTANWLISGTMAPLVITLFAIGLILLIRFSLDFATDIAGVGEIVIAVLILAGSVVLWRAWKPENAGTRSATVHPMPGPSAGPLNPDAGAPLSTGGGRKRAA